MAKPSTEFQRKKNAERQKKWRHENPDKFQMQLVRRAAKYCAQHPELGITFTFPAPDHAQIVREGGV